MRTERAIDEAEQTLRDGLESENPTTRLKAAAYFLRLSAAGRRRGWGRRSGVHDEPVGPQTITLKWIYQRPNPKASRRIVESEHDS